MRVEIAYKYDPFDFAMLSIWRGGSLSFVSRLAFIVHLSLARAPFPFHNRPRQQTSLGG